MATKTTVRRSKMDVIDFVHGGYICDGSAYMDVRLRCPKCGKQTGWRRNRRTPTYCDHAEDSDGERSQ